MLYSSHLSMGPDPSMTVSQAKRFHFPRLLVVGPDLCRPGSPQKSYSFGDDQTQSSHHHSLVLVGIHILTLAHCPCFQHINFKGRILLVTTQNDRGHYKVIINVFTSFLANGNNVQADLCIWAWEINRLVSCPFGKNAEPKKPSDVHVQTFLNPWTIWWISTWTLWSSSALPHSVAHMHVGEQHSVASVCCCQPLNNCHYWLPHACLKAYL